MATAANYPMDQDSWADEPVGADTTRYRAIVAFRGDFRRVNTRKDKQFFTRDYESLCIVGFCLFTPGAGAQLPTACRAG